MAEVNPSLAPFLRAGQSAVRRAGWWSSPLSLWAASTMGEDLDPRLVSEASLEAMGTHPTIYLAERMTTGVIRRDDLFTVKHPDPVRVAETEEWLWPLLPQILSACGRAYAYGSRGLVFDWAREDLRFRAPQRSDPSRERQVTLRGHAHYVAAHSIRRSEVEVFVRSDEVAQAVYYGQTFGPDRFHLLVWDPEHEGDTRGQGARVRAWRDYCALLVLDALEASYLERSVDSPRVAFVPDGTQEVDGDELSNAEYATELLMALRGSGVLALPSDRDGSGNEQWKLETLDLPDRENVWVQAIKRRETRLMLSYLALLGADVSAGASRTIDGLLKEVIQDIAQWVASVLTRVVERVHLANHDPALVPPPEVVATDVGRGNALRMLKEVLGMIDGGEVQRWLDVQAALDRLGVPVLQSPDAPAPAPAAPPAVPKPVGRPRDETSDRQDRRDNARTPEGEEDTGQRGDRPGGQEA